MPLGGIDVGLQIVHFLVKLGYCNDLVGAVQTHRAIDLQKPGIFLALVHIFRALQIADVGGDITLPGGGQILIDRKDPTDQVGVGTIQDAALMIPNFECNDLASKVGLGQHTTQHREVPGREAGGRAEFLQVGCDETGHIERRGGSRLAHHPGFDLVPQPPADPERAQDHDDKPGDRKPLKQAQTSHACCRSGWSAYIR